MDVTGAHSAYFAYRKYLALETLLTIQRPNTGQPDELLFVIVHQSHELWFKELLQELSALQAGLSRAASGPVLRTLRRLHAIFKVLTAQIDALETMTSGQFDVFRGQLGGSGFYSAQFREIEMVLGRRDPALASQFPERSEDRARIEARSAQPTLFDSFTEYLSVKGYLSHDLKSALRDLYLEDEVAAQVCEGLVDLDQAFQEWRFRHAVLVRRIIGDKTGTGGTTGAEFLRRSVFTPTFPDLWHAHTST
jgi:tryptophan 2,3-dioxygenase